MNILPLLLLLKCVLAFCSIVYELVLAQSLSAFFENTVLRYSVTIGLYMCSMGFGALLAERPWGRPPALALLRIEILLTVMGGFGVVWMHVFDMLDTPRIVFAAGAHGLIIAIGVLTGMEVPLIIDMAGASRGSKENLVLAVDYAGALAGTILFAFVFYPVYGLMRTALLVGFLNACCGLMMFFLRHSVDPGRRGAFQRLLAVQAGIGGLIAVCLANAETIAEFFLNRYLH